MKKNGTRCPLCTIGANITISPRHTSALTCVTPAGDVTVAGLFEHPLPLHGQTRGKNVAAERHALSGRVAHSPRRQTHQGQVVIIAVGVIAWVEDDLINSVLLLILLRDEGVVVAHSDFVLLGAVSISAHRNGGMREHRQLERKEKRFCMQSVFTGGT